MLRMYEDIRAVMGEPLWFDDHGVPRYIAFSPERLGVYIHECALVLIGCQSCNATFKVAFGWNPWGGCATCFRMHEFMTPERLKEDGLHYGDPPRHDCPGAGETMNCDDIRVLEWWRRQDGETVMSKELGVEVVKDPVAWMEWRRVPELEVPLCDAGDYEG